MQNDQGGKSQMTVGTTDEAWTAAHPRVAGRLRRLVIVADNSLIVEAIRIAFRNSGEFNLVGYADGHRTSPERVLGAQPDVILLDDMDRSDRAVELTRQLVDENQQV